MSEPELTEEQFKLRYITSAEICKLLGVNRSSLMQARRRGMLPNAMRLPKQNGYAWDRVAVKPFLDAWTLSLASRRGLLK